MKRIISLLVLVPTFVTLGCSSTQKTPNATTVAAAPAAQPSLPTSVDDAVASQFRTDSNRARDQYRHPAQTLNFFGVRPDMTVVEISPGEGWYLEILAPLLATNGHYIAAMPPLRANAEANAGAMKILNWEKSHPDVGAKTTSVDFNPPDKIELAPEGSVDMVVTFRNVHNWMMKGSQKEVFKAFFKALKPGGILGLVEHRADPKAKRDPEAKSGYVLEKDVIALAQSVGFKLDGKSELNANPKDTKDYENGVWTLPPTLRLGDKDREKYLAIGESDRMTMRFVKPAGKGAKRGKKK